MSRSGLLEPLDAAAARRKRAREAGERSAVRRCGPEVIAYAGQPICGPTGQRDAEPGRRMLGEVPGGEPAHETGGPRQDEVELAVFARRHDFRDRADSRLFAFCNASTSSALLIFDRPSMSSRVARW